MGIEPSSSVSLSALQRQFGAIDVAFLPVAPDGEPDVHLNHRGALEAFESLGAKLMVPIHWGAYRTGDERIEEPLEKLQKLLEENSHWNALQEKVFLPKLGELVSLGKSIPNVTPESEDRALFQNLEEILKAPSAWWKFQLEGSTIKKAPFIRQLGYWSASFFTCSHKHKLSAKLQEDLAKISLKANLSQEQKIIREKISRLIYKNSPSWLKNISSPLSPAPRIFRTHQKLNNGSLYTPFKKNKRYYNHKDEKIWSQFLETLRLLFPGKSQKTHIKDLAHWNRVAWEPCSRSDDPKFTWLGHSTLLLQVSGFNILIDPTFHFVFPCFHRYTKAGIPFEKLPAIDLVVISHNHADHFEKRTLKALRPYQPIAFVPKGLGRWFRRQGYSSIEEVKWWSQVVLTRNGKEIKITAVPAHHGSQTGINDINRSLWMGVVIEAENKKFYFAGDTAYDPKIFAPSLFVKKLVKKFV